MEMKLTRELTGSIYILPVLSLRSPIGDMGWLAFKVWSWGWWKEEGGGDPRNCKRWNL